MYDATGKSNSEVISELLTMLEQGKVITLQELVDIVAIRSVVDTVANENAPSRVD